MMTPATGTGVRRMTTGGNPYTYFEVGPGKQSGEIDIADCGTNMCVVIHCPDDPFMRAGLAGLIAPEGYQLVRADSLKRLKRLARHMVAAEGMTDDPATEAEYDEEMSSVEAALALIQPEDYE